ncbi:MAG: SgcJ/EcaC family oxidoreductase [candidate division Zixibacteria bacterium]|nr:SgcJ/EcaC family oxidoreductase [candidate division Zixibacteria bacterium]
MGVLLAMAILAAAYGCRSKEMRTNEEDWRAIEAIVSGMEQAWAKGDGQAWAGHFAANADFTVWFGLYLSGRDSIAAAHQQIFDSFYRNTKLRLEVRDLRFLRPDVAVVHLNGWVANQGEEFSEQPHIVPVAILTKDGGQWRIAVFHNTKNTVQEHLGKGDIRK